MLDAGAPRAYYVDMTRAFIALCLVATCSVSTVPLPAQTPVTRTATLLWQVDGSESGEPFGDLRDYVMLRDGTVWALDFKDQIIRRYAANGAALAIVGRKGSGPGELRNANGLAVAPDGTVWVNDPANGRLSLFAPNGTAQRAITRKVGGYGYRWEGWFDASGDLIEQEIGSEARFRRLDRNGTVLGTVAYPMCGPPSIGAGYRAEGPGESNMFGAYPFTRGGGIVADRRGHFWCASARGTRVARLAFGKTDTVARTAVDIPLLPVSADERSEAIRSTEARLAKYATNDFDRAKVPTIKSGIASLSVDDDGRLWVAHTAPWQKTSSTYDVFDGSGKALFRVTLPVRASPYLPVIARGNEFVIAVTDADDVVSLAKYRLR